MTFHVRLISPPSRTSGLVAALTSEVGVSNLVVLPGTAQRLGGDAVQFDVAPRSANQVFRQLEAFRDNGSGMVAADIIEGAELIIVAPHDDDRLAGKVRSKKLPFLADLICPADDLPGAAEHARAFQIFDAPIAIPRGWDRGGFFQRVRGIVEIEDFLDGLVHGCSWACSIIRRFAFVAEFGTRVHTAKLTSEKEESGCRGALQRDPASAAPAGLAQ